jgi:hypothetical protein
MLSGYKTYIIMALGVIFNGLWAMGLVPVEFVPVVNSILAFLGLGALRASK